jgi:hypothetical protein
MPIRPLAFRRHAAARSSPIGATYRAFDGQPSPNGFSRWVTVTQRVFSDVPPSPNGFSRWATVTQRCFRTCRRHPTRFSRSVTVTQRVFSESLAEASWRWYKTNSWRSFFRVRGTFPLAIAPALHKLFGTKA